ncbi:MAG: alpha/beta hydrolase [Cytophagales bacterium]|nr:MAG: alpha/beta hydrolase [Cytophagales bacterium]
MRLLSPFFLLLFSGLTVAQTNLDPLFTSFDGTQIHYEVVGEGKPVVLLHGFIVNGESWKRSPARQMLVDAGFKVVTLDLRGNGRSDKPHTLAAYENDAEARDVMGLMKQLALTNYDVVGYSRGAIITARLLELDKQVRRAVMGGMGADFTDPNWPRHLQFTAVFQGQAHRYPQYAGAVEYARKSGADTLALGLIQQAQPATSRQVLGRVRQPVLVISGDADTDNGRADDLAELLPNSTLVTVPGATHNDTMSKPAFGEAIVKFLSVQ